MRIFGTNAMTTGLVMLVYAAGVALVTCTGMARQTPAQGSAPVTAPQASVPDPQLPTPFVVGDSTASNSAPGQRGWGDPFADFFDPKKINVVNRARGPEHPHLHDRGAVG